MSCSHNAEQMVTGRKCLSSAERVPETFGGRLGDHDSAASAFAACIKRHHAVIEVCNSPSNPFYSSSPLSRSWFDASLPRHSTYQLLRPFLGVYGMENKKRKRDDDSTATPAVITFHAPSKAFSRVFKGSVYSDGVSHAQILTLHLRKLPRGDQKLGEKQAWACSRYTS